jgi:UDP-glucose 6-dehydrogenase
MSIYTVAKTGQTCHTIDMNTNETTWVRPTNSPPMMTDEAMADLYARQMDKQVYATNAYTAKKKLNAVTWCLGDTPNKSLSNDLLWADKRKGR